MVILSLEVRELCSLQILTTFSFFSFLFFFFFFLFFSCFLGIFLHAVIYLVFLSNTNDLHAVICVAGPITTLIPLTFMKEEVMWDGEWVRFKTPSFYWVNRIWRNCAWVKSLQLNMIHFVSAVSKVRKLLNTVRFGIESLDSVAEQFLVIVLRSR